MHDWTDQNLLRQYVDHRSEAAFAELVRRHIDLIHSAALRMAGNAHLAEDVSQNTFVALAQNARQLIDRPVLAGWLHRTARNLAVKIIRSDARRRAREQEAVAMNELFSSEPDATWEHLRPHLDDALDDLSEPERDALLLRYFEGKSAREIAQTLRISDDAAQKRVNRAVERLRALFAKRGLAIGAGGLAAALSAHATQAAPIGIAATISTAAMTAPVIPGLGFASAGKTLTAAAIKKTSAIALVAASLVLPFWVNQNARVKLRGQNEILSRQQNELTALQTQIDDLSNQMARRDGMPTVDANDRDELLKLRGQVGRLRSQIQQLSQLPAETPVSRTEMLASMALRYTEQVNQLKEMLAAHPSEEIPELQFLTETDWRDIVNREAIDEEGFLLAASTARSWAENKFVNDTLYPALKGYAKDHEGQFPGGLDQLKAYFKSPVDDAILQRWQIVSGEELGPYMAGQTFDPGDHRIAPKAPVNPALDMPTLCGLSGVDAYVSRPSEVWASRR